MKIWTKTINFVCFAGGATERTNIKQKHYPIRKAFFSDFNRQYDENKIFSKELWFSGEYVI